jgi:hypothetical protein
MSLYEQFFSDINKDFMFNMANNVLKKDHNIIIEGDEKIKEEYFKDMKEIFEKNNFEDLSDINKLLLDTTIKKNKVSNNIVDEENTEDITFSGYRKINEDSSEKNENKLADLIKERESVKIPPSPLETKDQTNENDLKKEGTSIEDLFKNTNGTKIETIIEEPQDATNISDILENKTDITDITDITEEELYPKNLKLVSFTSNRRTSINSSRYNYTIDLEKENIDPLKLHSLSKLIIPIEDNYIFSLPILTLIIKELDMEVCFQQKDIIENEFNTVGIYEPIENIIFSISYPLRKISIDIRDISKIKYSTNDILKINIMEIKKNVLIFTCSKIDSRNFKIKDIIKIINIQTYDMGLIELLSNPLKIKAIKDNMVFCKVDGEHPDKVFNNIDMKILNISNQNMIYFNQYS